MPALKKKKREKKSQQMVRTAMHEMKRGKLHSGSKTGPKVKNRRQAIAIGLSEARKGGAKIPKPKGAKKAGGIEHLQHKLTAAHSKHTQLKAKSDMARAHVDMIEAKAKSMGHAIKHNYTTGNDPWDPEAAPTIVARKKHGTPEA